MNNHQRARQLAAAAIDFELAPRERHELAEHLSTCDPCRGFDAGVRSDMAALRSISWRPAPARVREAVSDAVAVSERIAPVAVEGRLWKPLTSQSFGLNRVAVVVALLATLLLSLTLSGFAGRGRPLAVTPPTGPPPVDVYVPPLAITSTIRVCPAASGLQANASALWFVCGGEISRADVAARTSGVIVGGTAIAAGPAGLWAIDSASVLRLDPITGAILARIAHAGGVAVAVGTEAVWIADMSAGTVTRIDPATNRVGATIRVGSSPVGITVASGAVWVADRRPVAGGLDLADTVSRIDPATDSVTATIVVDHGPSPTLFVAGAVWVANASDGTVSRIDPSTNRPTRLRLNLTLQADVVPAAASLDSGWLWAIDAYTGDLVVIAPGPPGGTEPNADLATAQVVERDAIPGVVPGSPTNRLASMAFLDGDLWVSDAAGSLLQIATRPSP
jgi:YVTN family beta-propeller protein